MEIRKLDSEQRDLFSRAMFNAIEFVPTFRDTIAILRPFYDPSSPVVYVDQYARMGLSSQFFERSLVQRTTTVLHEALHVLNQHLLRGEEGAMNGDEMLLAADFEVGSTLIMHPKTDTSHQVMPNRDPFTYPLNKTFEQYYIMLQDDPPDDGESGQESSDSDDSENSDGSNNDDSENSESNDTNSENDEPDSSDGDSSGDSGASDESDDEGGSSSEGQNDSSGVGHCHVPTPDQEHGADEAGIEKVSDSELNLARNNTRERIKDELRSAGSSAMGQFLGCVDQQLTPPKENWKTHFRKKISRTRMNIARGRTDYTYKRVNRKRVDSEFIFPGMQTYIPVVMAGLDASASMQKNDYISTLSEIEGILKSACAGRNVKMFTLDTAIAGKVQTIRKATDLQISGGGGTDMAPAFEYIYGLSRKSRPDIFVLATDGGLSWQHTIKVLEANRHKRISLFVLVTEKYGFQKAHDALNTYATVIDISS